MPFTVDGQWVPKPTSVISKKPVKVHLVKRGNNVVTIIQNLPMNQSEISQLASTLKKKLGCGGAVKGSDIEIQGDRCSQVRETLNACGIKC